MLDPTLPYIDAVINQWKDGESNIRTEEPPAGRADEAGTASPSIEPAAAAAILLGTAAVLAGGHSLAKCRSGWRRRWLSQRIEREE